MRSIRLPFDWIDILVIPIATSIMETQPFAIVLLFFSLLLAGNSASVPLDAVNITLLMLGLHWWAQLARFMQRRGLDTIRTEAFQLCGLLLALAVTILIHLSLLRNVLVLLLVTALVLFFWMRGRLRVQGELSEAHLLFSFKLCFAALLAVLIITIPLEDTIAGTMLTALAIALPLFFLSGLLALSFIRLSTAQQESRRDAFGTRLERSHAWALFLALSWSLLVIVTILLEAFAFQPLLTLLTPLINAILSLSQFFSQRPSVNHTRIKPTPTPIHFSPGQGSATNLTLNPLLFVVIFVILGIIVLAGFLFVLISVLLARNKRNEEELENLTEKRTTLSVRSTLNQRRKRNTQRKTKFRLETLDPNSVRARYRDLLLATAQRGGDIQRHPDETPAEYQQRLLAVMASLPNKEGEPPNTAILTELTEAYSLERYGRKQTAPTQVGYLKKWVQLLVKRLKSKKV